MQYDVHLRLLTLASAAYCCHLLLVLLLLLLLPPAAAAAAAVCVQGFRSLLTDSQDASYLFNAVLDAVVDHTLPLVQVRGSEGCGVLG
jgi:hypothetical protein